VQPMGHPSELPGRHFRRRVSERPASWRFSSRNAGRFGFPVGLTHPGAEGSREFAFTRLDWYSALVFRPCKALP